MNSDALNNQILAAEPQYEPETGLLGNFLKSPGYHTRVPDGTYVHQTKFIMNYALALLVCDRPGYRARAEKAISAVLDLQVTDPYDPAYGIWPWLCEEPVPEMAPPDWNWADFIGAVLCHIAKEHASQISPALLNRIREALRRAAWSIFRRNVQPGYTNIALMGAMVTGAAGEILEDSFLLDYGRRRLERFLEYTKETGGLNEFNSPTYTFVALNEVERILQLIQDDGMRRTATELHRLIWNALAERFHASTGQLAGPHSRCYANRLNRETRDFLCEATGLEIPFAEDPSDRRDKTLAFHYEGIRHLPCPAELIPFFRDRVSREIRTRFIKGKTDASDVIGCTRLDPEWSLGSVNRDILWAQRRSLLAYWIHEPLCAVLRLRFLHDGKDFTSGGVHSVQKDNRVLFGIQIWTNLGDFHPNLDRPSDGLFRIRTLSVCLELNAPGAAVRSLPSGCFELSAGKFKGIVHPHPGTVAGFPARWECSEVEGGCRVEAVLYDGPERTLPLNESTASDLCASLEILPAEASPECAPIQRSTSEKTVEAVWGDLRLAWPLHAEKHF